MSLKELTKNVNGFLGALTLAPTKDLGDIDRRGTWLSEILIRPVIRALEPADVIFIVPDKILNRLPFGALILPETGRYFIEDYAFEIAPSCSIMISCSDRAVGRAKQREEKLLSVGNPSFDRSKFPGLPDLPAAAREAESVAGLYGALPLTGQDAQAVRVKERMLEADVIHFAGHFVQDERSPMLSTLLLSKAPQGSGGHGNSDGALTASEVYGMKLRRARLVVLSACATGVERYYRGEGSIGIARPFIEAGAPLVVASLWPVDSEQTAHLMIAFHHHRKLDGMSAVRALRQAQLDMLNSQEPDNREPRAWAAFQPIGGLAEF